MVRAGGGLSSPSRREGLVLGGWVLEHLSLLLPSWVQGLGRRALGGDGGGTKLCLGGECWLQGSLQDGVWHGRRQGCHLIVPEKKVQRTSLLSHQRMARKVRNSKGIVDCTSDPGSLLRVTLALNGQNQGIAQSTDNQIDAPSCPRQCKVPGSGWGARRKVQNHDDQFQEELAHSCKEPDGLRSEAEGKPCGFSLGLLCWCRELQHYWHCWFACEGL